MERDFMGLKAKNSPVLAIKEEVVEESKDSEFGSSGGVLWSLQNKVFAVPHFTSVKSEHDEKPSRMMFDAGASHGRMNFAGACVKKQLVSGNHVAAPYAALPSFAPVVGATEPWINSKATAVPSQLTIFYDGIVTVFDDISSEKVQAIMILAAKMAQAKTDVQTPVSVPGTGELNHISADRALANHSAAMPSPISISSRPVDQSAVATANEDIKVSNTTLCLSNKGEPPVTVIPSGPVGRTAMLSAAVPQARKASLARFLEKRKERAMQAAPYNLCKNEGNAVNGNGFCVTSGIDSCSSNKEINAEV